MDRTKNIPVVSFPRFLKHSLEIVRNPLPFHHGNFERLGDTFRLMIGIRKSVIFSRDAGLLEYVLRKNHRNYTKSEIQTKDVAKYLGKGLLTAEGDHWRRQRRLIQPAFHKQRLEALLTGIRGTISEALSAVPSGRPVDVFPIFNDLAFKTVVRSLFSNAATDHQIEQLQTVTESNQAMLVRELRQPYLKWYFKSSGKIDRNLRMAEKSRALLLEMVRKRRDSGERFDDLLDLLMDARYEDGGAMDDDQLIDEILVLFVAGHETTANALSFTVQLLAHHPEWQEVLRESTIDFETRWDHPMEALGSLRKTQQVVEESLRMFPPGYFIDRVNLADDGFGPYHFPAGSNLLFSVYEIHRHPGLWDRPESFRPERFDPKAARKHTSYYFPFGAGPRKCIGNNFAMFEMLLAVYELISRYRIYPIHKKIAIHPLITLRPKEAMVRFERRE